MSKRSQVWVETAIYTLIGLVIISVLLSAALPQIDKWKDKEIVKQATLVLEDLNQKVIEVKEFPGVIRIAEIKISNGKFKIDSTNDLLEYTLSNTKYEYTEPGLKLKKGDIDVLTEKYASRFNIILSTNYSKNLNLTYKMEDNDKSIQPGSSVYKIYIENTGITGADGRYVIDFEL